MTGGRSGLGTGAIRAGALCLVVVLTACQSTAELATPTQAGGASSAAPGAQAGGPNASGAPAAPASGPAVTQLPPDIVASVDAIMTASTADAATAATRKVLEMSGIIVADTAAARTGSRARTYVTTIQLQEMALEAQQRESLSRVSFQEFAATVAGVAGLPVGTRFAAPAQTAVTNTQVVDQPLRLATFVTSWVKLALEYHGSSDPDEAALTNAPLVLAALAQRQDEPVDLAQPFLPSDLRLGPLDLAVLVGGVRAMLLAAQREVPASPRPSASPSASIRPSASPSPSPRPSPTPTPRVTPSTSPTRIAPSASPATLGGAGARVAALTPIDTSLVAPADEIACAGVLEAFADLAPGVADGYSWATGTLVKAFAAKALAALRTSAELAEEVLASFFEVLGIIFRLQALVLLYQSVEVKTELSPNTLHKAIDTKTSVTAKITAGVPDDKWNKFREEREKSQNLAGLRDCLKVLGLPSPGSLADIPEQMKSWRAAWNMKDPGHNAEFPIQQFAGGGLSVLGRLERPLKPVNDHAASDEVEVLVLPEKTTDHPGLAKTAHVRICNEVRTNEPPNIGLILNPSLSGSGAIGVITQDAKKVVAHASKVFTPSAVASLVATIVDLLAGWVQFSHTLKSCGTLNVGFHEPQPGQWNGTVVIKSEYESRLDWTEQRPNQCTTTHVCAPEQNVMRYAERDTIRNTFEFIVSGTEPARAPGSGGPSAVSLSGKQLTYGFNEFVVVSLFYGYSPSGCLHTIATSRDHAGTFYLESDLANVTIQLDASGKYKLTNISGGSFGPAPTIPGRDAQVTESQTRGCSAGATSRASDLPVRVVGPDKPLLEGQLDPRSPGSRISGSVSVFNVDGSSSTITWRLQRVGTIALPSP